MSANADAAAHVAHQQVQILVLLAHFLGVALGNGLLVQSVEGGAAGDNGMTGIACHGRELIHHRRIHDKGGDAQLIADLAGNEAAQIAGVLTADAGSSVSHQLIGGGVRAAAQGSNQTTASGNGRQGSGIKIVLLQSLHHQILAPALLIGNRGELGNLFSAVTQRLGEQLHFILKHTDLGGGGAGVNDQNTIGHNVFLPKLNFFCPN